MSDSPARPASDVDHEKAQNSPQDAAQQPQPATQTASTQEAGHIPQASPAAPRPIETYRPVVQAVRGGNGRFEPLKPVEPPKAQSVALLNSPKPAEDNDLGRRDTRIGGLDDIPKLWPDLAANVSTSVETAWVQANRLLVVKETSSGRVKVDLSKARSPAPSLGTLFWLETAIKNPAKFIEVASKQASSGQDEAEFVRKERMQIGEIRAILEEMKDAGKD